jgi:hypothetical protein
LITIIQIFWISKTAGEATGNPYNPAWQHTKLDRYSTRIAYSHDDGNSYVYAVKIGDDDSAGHIYRLKYPKNFQSGNPQEDPQLKDWEKIQVVSLGPMEKSKGIVYTDSNRLEKAVFKFFSESLGKSRIFYSLDYGTSWVEMNMNWGGFPFNNNGAFIVEPIKFDPEVGDKIFLLVIYQDVELKSAVVSYNVRDRTWETVSEEFDYSRTQRMTSFSLDPDSSDTLYVTVIGNLNGELGIGQRISGDYQWQYKNINVDGSPIPKPVLHGISVNPYNPNELFLGISSSQNPGALKQYEIRGPYKSSDAGNNWTKVAESDHEYMSYLKESFSFHPQDPDIMYAGFTNFDALRKSVNGGNSWYPIVEGLSGINVFGVAVTDTRVYGVVQSAVSINEDSLNTHNWVTRQITSPQGTVTANLYGGVEIDPFDESIVLIGAGYWSETLSSNGGVFRHTNFGYTNEPIEWERVLYDSVLGDGYYNPQIMDILFSETTSGLVFAAAMKHNKATPWERGLYVSYDHGNNWEWIYTESDIYQIVQDPYDPYVYYAVGGTEGSGVILKITETNGDVSIDKSSVSLLSDYFYSIDIQQGLSENTAYAFIGTYRGKLHRMLLSDLRSFNFGNAELSLDFREKLGDYAFRTVVTPDPNIPEMIYAGAFNGGIFRSSDSGVTWEEFSYGLESSSQDVYELKFSPDGRKLFAGTLGSIAVGVCDYPPETHLNCPQDCPEEPVCGNGICESGETSQNCPEDCTLHLDVHVFHSVGVEDQLLKELNSNTIRVNLPWNGVEPTETGGFVWGDVDQIVDPSEENNIDIIFVFRSISTWGTKNPPKKQGMFIASSMPKDMERWKRFVTAAVNKYKDRKINIHYEIENEVNAPAFWNGTIEEYAELLKASYAAIKQANPNTFVFASSLACGISKNVQDQWMKDFLRKDYSTIFSTKAFDGVSVHNYYFPDHEVNGFTFTSFIEFTKEVMQEKGVADKPIWVTEFGYVSKPTRATGIPPSYGDRIDQGSPEKQAQWLSGAYDQALGLGLTRMFWIKLRDDEEPYAGAMGLMTEDDAKKPAYYLLAELNKGEKPVCSNGICEAGETCSYCPQDCGTCWETQTYSYPVDTPYCYKEMHWRMRTPDGWKQTSLVKCTVEAPGSE